VGLPGVTARYSRLGRREVPVIVDGDFNGAPRKMVMQASRNGYFFVLDRTTARIC